MRNFGWKGQVSININKKPSSDHNLEEADSKNCKDFVGSISVINENKVEGTSSSG